MANTNSRFLGARRFGEKSKKFETVAGLCIVGKEFPDRTRQLCTGSIVSCRESIVLVTSETIFPEEKRHPKEWTETGFVLTFKKKGNVENTETFKLQELTGSKEAVIFDQGLIIIPLDSQKANESRITNRFSV